VASYWTRDVLWSLLLIGRVSGAVHDVLAEAADGAPQLSLIGDFRYCFETIAPNQQYFVESNPAALRSNRDMRSLVLKPAQASASPTRCRSARGSRLLVAATWVNHLAPLHVDPRHAAHHRLRPPVRMQPYSASIFNISAMSYVALSKTRFSR